MTTLKTRARIFVLVILAALPARLLTIYSAVERRASTENQACAELRRLVKLAAMQQWQVVEGARQMMVASSQILFTLLSDRKRCTEYFAGLFAQNREAYSDIACRYGGEEFALIWRSMPPKAPDAIGSSSGPRRNAEPGRFGRMCPPEREPGAWPMGNDGSPTRANPGTSANWRCRST
jgi:hypothetical protein